MEFREYEKLNFDSLYQSKKYPKKLWPILNEYFSRYKNEFGLSYDEIHAKVGRVLNNLDVIKKGGTISDRWNGVFIASEKEIKINMDNINYYKLPMEQVINTIFHELNHAGEYVTGNLTTSFQLYNENTERWEGTALNEIITEMRSSRLACNDRTDLLNKTGNERETLDLTGYGDLIFMGTMLHTALGIGEKEFLVLADKGRAEFDRQMREKFPPGDETYDNFMSSFIYYSDMLHAIKYNGHTFGVEQDKENLLNCINGIRDHCMYAMGRRMSYEAFKNRGNINMAEFVAKSRYELEKLNINYTKGMSYIFPDYELDHKSIYEDDVKRKIVEYETLDRYKDKLSFSEMSELLYLSSEGNFISEKLEQEYGILVPHGNYDFSKTMDLEYETKLLKEEYSDRNWDNSEIMTDIKNFAKRNLFSFIGKTAKVVGKSFKDAFNDIKNNIKNIKTAKEWGKLPEPKFSELKIADEKIPEMSDDDVLFSKTDMSTILKDMVKTDEEIYMGQDHTKVHEKDEIKKDHYLGLE